MVIYNIKKLTMDGVLRTNSLRIVSKLLLFLTSYSPLFVCIIVRQLYYNRSFLHFVGFDKIDILCLLQKIGLSIFLGFLLVFVTLLTIIFIKNLRSISKNGNNVTVKSISNKNAESIGYIATYIIPFLFQSFDELGDIIPLLILLIIIYRIYVTSSLLLVNPVLNCRYSLFEMEYEEKGEIKQGLMISPFRDIYESDNIKIFNIGYKLFYVNKINKK